MKIFSFQNQLRNIKNDVTKIKNYMRNGEVTK